MQHYQANSHHFTQSFGVGNRREHKTHLNDGGNDEEMTLRSHGRKVCLSYEAGVKRKKSPEESNSAVRCGGRDSRSSSMDHQESTEGRSAGQRRKLRIQAAKISGSRVVIDQPWQEARGHTIGGMRLRSDPKKTNPFDYQAVTTRQRALVSELNSAVSCSGRDSSSSNKGRQESTERRSASQSRSSRIQAAKNPGSRVMIDQPGNGLREHVIGGARLRSDPKKTSHFDYQAIATCKRPRTSEKELHFAVSCGGSHSSSSYMNHQESMGGRSAGQRRKFRIQETKIPGSQIVTDQSPVQVMRGDNTGGTRLRSDPKKTSHFDYQALATCKRQRTSEEELSSAVSCGGSDSSSACMNHQESTEGRSAGQRRKFRIQPAKNPGSRVVIDQPVQDGPFLGRVVWAKLTSYRPWPAMLVKGSLFKKDLPAPGNCWVFWFGDHKVSEIALSQTKTITTDFTQKYNNPKPGKLLTAAVLEALKVCAERCHPLLWEEDDDSALLDWALSDFPTESLEAREQLCSGGQLPSFVLQHLMRIGEKIEALQEEQDHQREATPRRECVKDKEALLAPVRNGDIKIEDVCLACDELTTEVCVQHPLFRGGLCTPCKEDLMDSMFAIESDGNRVYCAVCGNGGEQFLCDTPDCGRVYCVGCVEILAGLTAAKQIREKDVWMCFLCSEHSPETHGLLEGKPDWKNNIMNLFHYMLPVSYPEKKGPIRVLSLFDGIGTGKYVLDLLGIDVEVYYASEIDECAIAVTKSNLTGNIIQLGNVRDITMEKLKSLGHIDLLVGGSPCNDLSLCNPGRKGLYNGTGPLFFQFLRIRNLLVKMNNGSFFWLFENVASMPCVVKEHISSTFKVRPGLWDAKYFSAQKRARYFWGNIPGLQCQPPAPDTDTDPTLQLMLTPNFNRTALVDKIRTVTTKSNSLLQHKDRAFPVEMNSMGDTIWIQELERIFGFPEHYTDVCNFTPTKRQQLLGKSWSVQVVKYLLSPLKDFFSCTPKS